MIIIRRWRKEQQVNRIQRTRLGTGGLFRLIEALVWFLDSPATDLEHLAKYPGLLLLVVARADLVITDNQKILICSNTVQLACSACTGGDRVNR